MVATNVIRTLTIRATTEGVDQAAASVDKLAKSQQNLAQAALTTEKASLSQEAAANRLVRRYDSETKSAQDLAKAQKQINDFRAQGIFSATEANRLSTLAAQAHKSAGDAARGHSKALQELATQSQSLSSNLGVVGGILSRMGPAGLAAGAALGAIALAFGTAANEALKFADTAGKLVDLSDTTGLTVVQLQGLEAAAAQVGISWEQLTTATERFAVSMGKLNEADKGTVEALERLGQGTAQQVGSLTTMSDRLDAVFQALTKVDAASAALSAKELFGKAGVSIVRLAKATVEAGGSIDDLVSKLNALDVITRENAERWDRLGDTIKLNLTLAQRNFQSLAATATLDPLNAIAEAFVNISRVAKDVGEPLARAFSEELTAQIVAMEQAVTKFLKSLEGLSAEQQKAKITEQLIDPRLVQTINDIINIFEKLIEAVKKAAAALTAFANNPFSLSSIKAAIDGVSGAFDGVRAAISRLGTTLEGQVSLDSFVTETEHSTAAVKDFSGAIDKLFAEGDLTPKFTIKPEARQRIQGVNLAAQDTAKTVKEKVNPAMEQLGQIAGQLGGALVTAFLNGDSAAKALNTTLKSIASTAASAAINNLIKGDIGGAAISGGIALGAAALSFLFGDDEDEEQQRQEAQRQAEIQQQVREQVAQAQAAFAALTDELRAFNKQALGLTEGTLPAALREFQQTGDRLMAAAAAAQDAAAVQAIGLTTVAGLTRILNEFIRDLPDMISDFGKGAIAQGKQEIRDLMNEFESLNDSLDELALRTGDTAGVIEAKTRLMGAAFEQLVSQLGDVPEVSEFVTEMNRLKGVASELNVALVELGVSAEDAAFIVSTRLNVSLQKLNANFLDPIIRQINEFVGGGWINEATDLLNQVRDLNRTATELGIKTNLINTFLILSAQDIINRNQLVGEQFQILARMLGIATDQLHEFNAAVEEVGRTAAEIAKQIQDNEDRLFLALHRSDSLADQLARFDLAAQREREEEIARGGQAIASLEAALAQERLNIINDFFDAQVKAAQDAADEIKRQNEQIAEENARIMQEAVDFIASQVRRIQDWIAAFLAGPDSILPPSQQLAQAQQHFASELALAQSGNRDALSNITTNAQTLVDATRRYFGSSTAGQNIIQQLLDQLRALPDQLSPEEFIVGELKPPIEEVSTTVETEVDKLAALMENLKLAIQSGDAQAIAVALSPLFNQLDTSMDGALSFAELQAGLSGIATDAQLQNVMNLLDANHDGLIQKEELIRIAAEGTKGNTGTTADKVATTNDLLNSLIALNGTGGAQYQVLVAILQSSNRLEVIMDDIRHWAPGSSHATGGLLVGPRHSAGGIQIAPGHYAEGGEYIMSRRAVSSIGVPTLDAMNFGAAGNDNNIFSAIRSLERSLLRGIKALMDTQMEAAGVITQPMREANKITKARRGEKKVA